MSHPIHRGRSFQLVGPYTLDVQFQDGLSHTIDFRPVLEGEMYGPLRPCVPNLSCDLSPERGDGKAAMCRLPTLAKIRLGS